MDLQELSDQNPWWKNKKDIEKDFDIERFEEKKLRWFPKILNEISFRPFSLHFLLGPRQAGKTTSVKLLIRNLLKEKDPKSIFYFNCENLDDFKELGDILETYLEFREQFRIKNSFIFLDEITSPNQWFKAIKFLIDKGAFKKDVLLLTGSSTLAIKKHLELFPGRRGNGADFLLLPLSFREFLKVLNPELHAKIEPAVNLNDFEKKAKKALLYLKDLNKELEKYFEFGGFPLAVESIYGNKEGAKRIYLSWIKNAVLKADKSDVIARQIIRAVLEKMPSPMSWGSIAKEIEIKSPKTVSSYLNLLQSMFAFEIVYNLDLSSKKIKFGKNKKIHAIDPFLLSVFEDWCLINLKNKKNTIAESLVATHLSRMFPERVFFWKNGFEIDSLVLSKKELHGFEVKWGEKTKAKSLPQLDRFTVVTKKEFNSDPLKIPLAVFLALIDVL